MARPTPIQDAPPVAVSQLPSLYALRGKEEVAAYLQQPPGVIQDLTDIADGVSRYFPTKSIAIEVLHDPEEVLTTLCVFIQAGRDAAHANAQLEVFDREWWLNSSVDMHPDISVDIEYR